MRTTLYFFLGVIITIIIGNSIIFFAESDSKIIFSNWILIINSLTAAGLSAMILLKDKDSDEGGDKTQYSSNTWSNFLVYSEYNMGIL